MSKGSKAIPLYLRLLIIEHPAGEELWPENMIHELAKK